MLMHVMQHCHASTTAASQLPWLPAAALTAPTPFPAHCVPTEPRYKTVILQEPLPEEGIQAVLDYASSGERGTRVFEFQASPTLLDHLLN